MKTLKISEDKALKLYKDASVELKEILEETFGKEFFKPKLITDIVHDLDSLMEYLSIDEDELYLFKNPKSAFQKYLNACSIIPKIVSVYNEGTVLDWNNTNEYKYIPYAKKVGSFWVVDVSFWDVTGIGPFAHHYKSIELVNKAVSNFKQTYLDYYTYKG